MRRAFPLLVLLALIPALSCLDYGSTTGLGNGDGNGDGDGDGDPYSHVRGAGASAHDFLSDDSFTALVVEVDYMAGYGPQAQALTDLETFLEQRLNKTEVTILEPTEIAAGGQGSYTATEIRALEEAHRDELSADGTLAAYMIIVDGEYDQANVLGIAHYNTSSAYFGAAFDQASGGLGQPSRRLTEATVFRHEFGHLFGLVAIPGSGTEMQTDHQDEAHGHHCDDDRCLMYYAIESTDLFGAILGSEIPELDANCLADLVANGGK